MACLATANCSYGKAGNGKRNGNGKLKWKLLHGSVQSPDWTSGLTHTTSFSEGRS